MLDENERLKIDLLSREKTKQMELKTDRWHSVNFHQFATQ